MLRLNASYSKKVPVQGQEFSSESYHASVEVEIPDGLTPDQLRERIHDTFAMVRNSVDSELCHGTAALPETLPQSTPAAPARPAQSSDMAASGKQVQYLTQLALRQGLDLRALNLICREEFGVESAEALSRRQASDLIDRMSKGSGNARPAARRAA
jgi:hypothetical protein